MGLIDAIMRPTSERGVPPKSWLQNTYATVPIVKLL